MEVLIALLAAGGIAWYISTLFKGDDSRAPDIQQQPLDSEFEKAQRTMKAALDICNTEHEPAVQALLWLAGTDGTISKQEARNVFRFCERQGTALPDGTYAALEYLNNGMRLSAGFTPGDALSALVGLTAKPIPYRAAFIGAAHAICGGNKRISKVKQDFLDRADGIVETRV